MALATKVLSKLCLSSIDYEQVAANFAVFYIYTHIIGFGHLHGVNILAC